jgi:integrase/recombinase XerD
MAKKKHHRKTRVIIPDGPDDIGTWMLRFLEWMAVTNYAKPTIDGRHRDLWQFKHWCGDRSLESPKEITKPMLERYQRHLYHYRTANGKALSYERQAALLSAVKYFFKWMAQQNHLLFNPASEIVLPRTPRRRLVDRLLQADEVERILLQPNTENPIGLRDRAMLELFYSTGIRRRECSELRLYDVDKERGTLFVRQGKGKKDRVVPVGERALFWLERYSQEVRPELCIDPSENALFLNYQGSPIVPDGISHLVRDYFQRAGVKKQGGAHMLRHTMATAMLDNGADIRYIQEILGHAMLDTTQQYTHVSIQKLKEIHSATHPGARLKKGTEADNLDDLLAMQDDDEDN